MNRSLLIAFCVATIASLSLAQENGETVEDRLKPFGNVCMEGDDCGGVEEVPIVSQASMTDIEVYNKHCFVCHATGVSDAPLVGSELWATRVDKGFDVLLENTRNGFNVVMPPMGTCMTCSDDELNAAIKYMITGKSSESTETNDDS